MRLPTLGRLTLPATGLLAAALTWGVMSAPAHAETDSPEPTTTSSTSTEPTASEVATAALAQVQSILEPTSADGVPQPADDSRDLTLALRDLRLHQDDLTARQRATAKRLAPTTRPLPTSAPFKDFGSVRVHWAADDKAMTTAWVDHVGSVVTHVLATYRAAGYRAPMSDGIVGGGNGLLDIYLVDFANDPRYGPGLYGFCDASVRPPASGPYNTPAFCAFDHTFAGVPGTVAEQQPQGDRGARVLPRHPVRLRLQRGRLVHGGDGDLGGGRGLRPDQRQPPVPRRPAR